MWRYPSQIFDASLPDNYKISARQRRAKWMASSHFSNAKRGNATQATTEFCIILFAATREIIAQQNRSRITPGGIDTSIILRWLKDNCHAEIFAFCAAIGQEEDVQN